MKSIAGSDERIAVATACGHILYFDSDDRILEDSIDFASGTVLLSTDGSILVAGGNTRDAQYHTDWSIRVLALPSGNEINRWTYTWPGPTLPFGISLSGSGTVLGQVLRSGAGHTVVAREVSTTAGSPIWSDPVTQSAEPIRLSPNGTLIAVANDEPGISTGTNIFQNGTLVTAVPGWAVGWIDDNRLLVNRHDTRKNGAVFIGASIHDASGAKIADPPLPELIDLQTVTSDSIYSPRRNAIYAISTGAVLWSSPNPSTGVGAIAGSRVVFASGSQVRIEPF